MTDFDYIRAESLEELIGCQAEDPHGTHVLAGGTDLLVFTMAQRLRPRRLVDAKPVRALDGVNTNGALRIGTLTRMRDIERHPEVRQRWTALATGASEVGSVQIRNRATLGGNLGTASPAADTPPALLALGARVTLEGPDGRRELPLDEFFVGPGLHVLQPGEVIVEVSLPAPAERSGSAYLKLATRKANDIAFVGVAAYVALDANGAVADASLGLGAVAPTPRKVEGLAELLRGRPLDAEALDEAAEAARQACAPISDQRCSADYRRAMAGVLAKRTLQAAAVGQVG